MGLPRLFIFFLIKALLHFADECPIILVEQTENNLNLRDPPQFIIDFVSPGSCFVLS